MADKACQDACVASYQALVERLCAEPMTNLIAARTNGDRLEAKAAFARGMALAGEVRQTCLARC